MTTTRVPLLELGSLQSRLPDLIAKKGEPPWSGDPLYTATRPASSAVSNDQLPSASRCTVTRSTPRRRSTCRTRIGLRALTSGLTAQSPLSVLIPS